MAFLNHFKYIRGSNYKELKKLPKLKIKDIKKWPEMIEFLAYNYYEYYNVLDLYDLDDINMFNIDDDLIRMNKLQILKYYEYRGINMNNMYFYYVAIYHNCNKLLPYFESIGLYSRLIDTNPFKYLYMCNINTYKYLYNAGFNLNFITKDNESFTSPLLYACDYYNQSFKQIKFLKSKGVNIYRGYKYGEKAYKKHKNNSFYKKIFIQWYCTSKLCYIRAI
jgi:hypothetical protein